VEWKFMRGFCEVFPIMPVDMLEEIQREIGHENDMGQNVRKMGWMRLINEDVASNEGGHSGQEKKKRKEKVAKDNMVRTMREVGNLIAMNLITASDNLSRVVIGAIAFENRSKFDAEL
jgi:hypothetical protein